MSTDNTVADRLLTDARKKIAKNESPLLARAALIVGVMALLVSPIPILGWVGGATALGLGGAAVRRPVSQQPANIAMALGVAAILVGVFFFAMNVARL